MWVSNFDFYVNFVLIGFLLLLDQMWTLSIFILGLYMHWEGLIEMALDIKKWGKYVVIHVSVYVIFVRIKTVV